MRAFFLLFLVYGLRAQGIETPLLTSGDIPGGTITRTERYDGTSLWGYIDGGADLYLEYGFLNVRVEEIRWHGHHFKIDVYTMRTAGEAYGVFSLSNRRCAAADSLASHSCVSPHQIQIAQGPLYITIVNDKGTTAEQDLARRLAVTLLGKSPREVYAPPRFFRRAAYLPYVHSLKYIEGPLGIQNGFPKWESLFEGLNGYALHVLPIETQGGDLAVAQIAFADPSGKRAFYKKLGIAPTEGLFPLQQDAHHVSRAVEELSPTEIRYIESGLSPAELAPFMADFHVRE